MMPEPARPGAPESQVEHLGLRDAPAAVGTLVRAFAADPILTHFFIGARRAIAYRLLFGDLLVCRPRVGERRAPA